MTNKRIERIGQWVIIAAGAYLVVRAFVPFVLEML
jgi:hypothetical protein